MIIFGNKPAIVTEQQEASLTEYMTLKQLREFVEATKDMPETAPVYYERIEDVYFERHGWAVLPVPDMYNRDMPDQFIRAWGVSTDRDGKRVLIHGHY